MEVFKKLFGDQNKKALKPLIPIVEHINELEKTISSFNDTELKEQAEKFKKRLKKEETLDDLLPEAFATVREAARRTLEQRHFDVQK